MHRLGVIDEATDAAWQTRRLQIENDAKSSRQSDRT
jgi:hypothetical protein